MSRIRNKKWGKYTFGCVTKEGLKETRYEDGEVEDWDFDELYWSYFDCLKELKNLGYPAISRMWYSV